MQGRKDMGKNALSRIWGHFKTSMVITTILFILYIIGSYIYQEGYSRGKAQQSYLLWTVCERGGNVSWPNHPSKLYHCAEIREM